MKKRFFLQALEFVCRIGLGALFIYSALSKISDPDEFAYSVSRYDLLPGFVVGIFSATMPMLELLAGLSMLFTKWLRESALLVSGMLAMFIVALVQALARGLEISCGCFGVPSVGGREEILMALVRDVVLIVPAVWLMFRQNGMIEPLGRMPKVWRIVCLCVFGALLAAWFVRDTATTGGFTPGLMSKADGSAGKGLAVSSGPIRPGEWNSDFDGVRAKAEREHRPMVLMIVGEGCRHCARLEGSMGGEIFRLWREDRAPLMAFVRDNSPLYSPETVKAATDVVEGFKKKLHGYPYVCVYWPQDGVTNGVAFSGRRGMMGGRQDGLLVMELVSALDRALGDGRTTGHKTLESIVNATAVRISARVEGAGGTVSMTPTDGMLPEGERVTLAAHPDAGYAFLDWRGPDGSLAGQESNLVVEWGMPIGCYTARFKSQSQCPPPLLISPAETSICVQVRDWFRHEILVDDACRPVKFLVKRPVLGVMVNPVTGVLRGRMSKASTNTVEVTVIGSDPAQTEKTVRLTIMASQREENENQ